MIITVHGKDGAVTVDAGEITGITMQTTWVRDNLLPQRGYHNYPLNIYVGQMNYRLNFDCPIRRSEVHQHLIKQWNMAKMAKHWNDIMKQQQSWARATQHAPFPATGPFGPPISDGIKITCGTPLEEKSENPFAVTGAFDSGLVESHIM